MNRSTPYTQLANVWDDMGQDEHSMKMADYTLKIMRKHKIKATFGLDLCCGTGTAIKLFLDEGFVMAGLDGSPEMLAVAARKLHRRGVRLYQKQLPKFRLLSDNDSRSNVTFDFVTSFYDSLNYLTSTRELGTCFKSVADHLHRGGWFIFDMNTPTALRTIWGGQTYAEARDDIAWVWRNDFNPRTNTALCRTTTFVKEGKLWRRFDEDHYERGYTNTVIRSLLREAGFVVKGFYRCYRFDAPTKSTYRICAVARKK